MAEGGNLQTKFKRLLKNHLPGFKQYPNPAQVYSGKYAHDMPDFPIVPLTKRVLSATTGPTGGLCQLDPIKDEFPSDDGPIAGVKDWNKGTQLADGVSLSLYDRVSGSQKHHGDPIADVYAAVTRENSGILGIADGINWGHKPRLAARCALNGSIGHINEKLFSGDDNSYPETTRDIFHTLLRSFEAAQKCILEHGGTTTTLSVAVVCELAKTHVQWGCCLVSVGDSLGYVYRRREGCIEELTSVAHQDTERDMKFTGGCLGPHIGSEPDLDNLTCIYAPLEPDDIVFLTTDGVSDNFDPVVRKEALPLTDMRRRKDSESCLDMSVSVQEPEHIKVLPFLTSVDRCDHSMSLMVNMLHKYSGGEDFNKAQISAPTLPIHLLTYCINITDKHRTYLENSVLPDNVSAEERRSHYQRLKREIKKLPGKLDHATVVAYDVRHVDPHCLSQSPSPQPTKPNSDDVVDDEEFAELRLQSSL